MEVDLGPGHFVPLPKKGQSPPPISAHVYCDQTAGWMKMALGVEVCLGPGHIVLDGDPGPNPQKGDRGPQFSTHFYCGKTAGCIKTPLGMEVKERKIIYIAPL